MFRGKRGSGRFTFYSLICRLKMRKFFILFFLIIVGCSNPPGENTQPSCQEKMAEGFSLFYSKFYNDINFQHERILAPLKGTITTWDDDIIKEESWDNKEITVTPKEKFLEVYKNLKTNLIKKDNIVIEKYWIEQSGFLIEKTFILKSGKWYLYSYNISAL